MSDLEKRLRALINERVPYGEGARQVDDVTMQVRHLMALAEDAARIGAELEREACALDMQHEPRFDGSTADYLASVIRARGGK